MANVLGKRYMCEKCGTEVLCNKAGTGGLECCDVEMKIKEAKPLPSSDQDDPVVTAPGKADLVLHQGLVLGHPGSDSVAISGGLIVAHGTFADLKPLVGPRTHLIKLAGRTVAPGFIDSHIHFREAAAAATGISVQRCRTVGDLLADFRLAAGKTPPGNWMRAFGCDEALMLDNRGPTRAELDQSLPKNPLRLRHQTLHATWLNSRAIALLGLEAPDFTPPYGANMIRDADGKLTGLVVGMETWLSDHLPPVTAAESESRARIMSREMAAAGVTAFTDATTRNGPAEVEQFGKLAQSGAICQRVSVMIGGQHLDAADRCAQLRPRRAHRCRRRQVHARLSVRRGRPLAPRSSRARARSRLRFSRDRNRRAGRGGRRDRSPPRRNSQRRARFRVFASSTAASSRPTTSAA